MTTPFTQDNVHALNRSCEQSQTVLKAYKNGKITMIKLEFLSEANWIFTTTPVINAM
jgi:hypothetical protein